MMLAFVNNINFRTTPYKNTFDSCTSVRRYDLDTRNVDDQNCRKTVSIRLSDETALKQYIETFLKDGLFTNVLNLNWLARIIPDVEKHKDVFEYSIESVSLGGDQLYPIKTISSFP